MRTLPADSGTLGVRRHLDPDRGAVGAAQAQQVVGDDAVAREAIDEHRRAPSSVKRSGSNGRSVASGVSAG